MPLIELNKKLDEFCRYVRTRTINYLHDKLFSIDCAPKGTLSTFSLSFCAWQLAKQTAMNNYFEQNLSGYSDLPLFSSYN
jgi:hypothetical protein